MYQDSRCKEKRSMTKMKVSNKRPSQISTDPRDCPVCFVKFCTEWAMKRHLQRYQNVKYVCQKCRITFTDGALLRFHIAREHLDIKKSSLECPVCSQVIQAKSEIKALQSHLFHYHKGWENLFASDSEVCPDGKGALSVIDNRVDTQKNGTNNSRKHNLIRLIKRLTRESQNETSNKGNDVGVRAQTKNYSKSSLDKRESSTSDESSSDEWSLDDTHQSTYDDIRRTQYRRSSRNSSGVAFRDAELRFIFSCKDCYVPLPRISPTLKTSNVQKTQNQGSKSDQDKDKNNQFEMINIQVAPERFSNPFIKSEVYNDESNDSQGFLLTDALEERYDPLSFPNMSEEDYCDVDESSREETSSTGSTAQYKVPLGFPMYKSEVGSLNADGSSGVTVDSLAQSCAIESVMTPLKEVPLGFPVFKSEVGSLDADESSGVTVDSFAQSCAIESVTTTVKEVPLGFPVFKSEVGSLDADGSSRVTVDSFAQSCAIESVMIPAKDEPMDIDEHSPPRTKSLRIINSSELFTIASVTSEFGGGAPDDTSAVLYAVAKSSEYQVKSEMVPVIPYMDCINEVEPVTSHSSQWDGPESSKIIKQDKQNRTMVASKICNKVFSNRRTMLRHFRDCHLIGTIDTSYCICGKAMRGRRAVEKHLFRHCDEVIETERDASKLESPCEALEKRYTCRRCGEKFWLESCRDDHPPHCEIIIKNKAKRKLDLKNAATVRRRYGGEKSGGYVCRVCDVRFSCAEALLRHVRALMTNESHPCDICKSVFPGSRFLKGHVLSTHKPPCIVHRCFCDICHQGFSKNIYKHVHMKHIHTKEVTPSVANTIDNYDHSVPVPVIANVNTPENQCNVCNIVFIDRKRFNDHMSYYNRNEPFRCNICGEIFLGQYKAHNHRKEVHYGGSVQNAYAHYCAICKEGFMYETHLHAHMFHVHDKEFNCVSTVKTSVCHTAEEKTLVDLDSNNEEVKSLANSADAVANEKTLVAVAGYTAEEKTLVYVAGDTAEEIKLANSADAIAKEKSLANSADTAAKEKSLVNSASHTVEEKSLVNSPTDTTEETSLANSADNGFFSNQVATISLTDTPILTSQSAIQSCQSIPTKVKCSRCNQRFSTWSGWSKHVKNFHTNDSKGPAVGFHFITTEPPSTNFPNVHNPASSDVTSNEKKSSKLNTNNRVGAALINDDDYKIPTNCSICGFECSHLGGLAKHESMFMNRGAYQCELCFRQFNWKSSYRDHKLKHSRHDVHNKCFCPICDEGFEDIVFLKMHTIHLHNQSLDTLAKRQNSTAQKYLNIVDDTKPSRDSNKPMCKQNDRLCNRFYVSLDKNVHSTVINNVGRKIYVYNEGSGLSRNLYRYDDSDYSSLQCESCNITFANSELRAIHDEIVHKKYLENMLVNKNVNLKDSSSPNVPDKSLNTVEPHGSTQSSENRTSNIVAITSRKIIKRITQKSGQIQATDLNPFDFSQCTVCNIVFGDKNLLAHHENQVHRSSNVKLSNDEQCSELSNSASQLEITASILDQPKTALATKQLSNKPNQSVSHPAKTVLQPVSEPKSPEVIDISDDETEEKRELPSTVKNTLVKANKIISTPLPNGMRLIKLPPGNYKIAKLKVRSVDTVVGKIMKYPKSTESRMKK